MVIRTQVQLTDTQMRRLRAAAAREGVSIAELVRRGIDLYLKPDDRQRQIDRALAAIGRFSDAAADVSERHDDYLDPAYRE